VIVKAVGMISSSKIDSADSSNQMIADSTSRSSRKKPPCSLISVVSSASFVSLEVRPMMNRISIFVSFSSLETDQILVTNESLYATCCLTNAIHIVQQNTPNDATPVQAFLTVGKPCGTKCCSPCFVVILGLCACGKASLSYAQYVAECETAYCVMPPETMHACIPEPQ